MSHKLFDYERIRWVNAPWPWFYHTYYCGSVKYKLVPRRKFAWVVKVLVHLEISCKSRLEMELLLLFQRCEQQPPLLGSHPTSGVIINSFDKLWDDHSVQRELLNCGCSNAAPVADTYLTFYDGSAFLAMNAKRINASSKASYIQCSRRICKHIHHFFSLEMSWQMAREALAIFHFPPLPFSWNAFHRDAEERKETKSREMFNDSILVNALDTCASSDWREIERARESRCLMSEPLIWGQNENSTVQSF